MGRLQNSRSRYGRRTEDDAVDTTELCETEATLLTARPNIQHDLMQCKRLFRDLLGRMLAKGLPDDALMAYRSFAIAPPAEWPANRRTTGFFPYSASPSIFLAI